MSIVTVQTTEVRGETRTTRTYHRDPDCSRIALADHAEGGGPADAEWDCDYCHDGAEMATGPIPGEDIPLPRDPREGRIDGGRGGRRRNQFGDARRPSEAQERYIRSLLRQLGSDADAWIADAERRGVWTKREASRLIDGLKSQLRQVGPDPAVANERRTNQYAGKCVKCAQWVDAGAGYLVKDSAGRWAAEHKGECPEIAPVVETEPCPVGIHRYDGQVYKVQLAVHGSGNPYAKLLVQGGFVYAQGAIRNLSAETLMTLDEARQYGEIYGVCVNCGATLTDEGSIANGIGPVCGQRILEWSTGIVLTKAQMTLYLEVVDSADPIVVSGLRKRTAQALADHGLVRYDGTTVRKAVA